MPLPEKSFLYNQFGLLNLYYLSMMKKYFQLVLLIGLFNSAYSQQKWTQKANYPDSISNAVGFSIGSLGYLGLGWNKNASQAFWSYNPDSNKWSKVADFPVANFFEPVALTINGEGYIGTGYENGSTYRKDFWKYNPQNNTWTKLKDFASLERSQAVGFEINGKGYMGLGFNGNPNKYLNDIWEYTPSSDSWKKVANFPGVARMSSTGFSINGKGYICSGSGTGYNYLNDLWEYDPQLVENPVKLTPCFRSKLTPGKMGSCKSDFRSNVTP
jgi:N-acetylneuraminic acid mutarotase